MNIVSNSNCIFDYYEIVGCYNSMINFPPEYDKASRESLVTATRFEIARCKLIWDKIRISTIHPNNIPRLREAEVMVEHPLLYKKYEFSKAIRDMHNYVLEELYNLKSRCEKGSVDSNIMV